MDAGIEQLILDEVRQLGQRFNTLEVSQERRLTTLETHDEDTYGNGQPGWKRDHDSRLTRIESKALLISGGALALAFVSHILVDLVPKLFK